MNTTSLTLKQKWDALKAERPYLRIRNAAEALGVTEVELLVLNLNNGITALEPKFSEILTEVEKLGKVMALTRNNECVHERKGHYINPDFSSPHAQLFVGEDIDLRIFLNNWQTAFAVVEGNGDNIRKSLQFFGKNGDAVHKIYLTKDSNEIAFAELVEKYKTLNTNLTLALDKTTIPIIEKKDAEIDVVNFQNDWKNLKDTHNFFGILRKYGLTRTQALRLAPDKTYAYPIGKDSIVKLLENASQEKLPIMVFVGNKGIIQIHTGEINKTMWHENWFNIMDADFNMHLDMNKIAQTWVVKKPTEDGVVTSIEVFNAEGEIIVQFFGKRKPGIPELKQWSDLVSSLS